MANFPPLDLELIPNWTPKIDKYRRISDEKQAVLDNIIKDLLEAKIIEPASGYTEFIANPHIVLQVRNTADGPVNKVRFTTDLKSQNKVLLMFNHPLLLMDEMINQVALEGDYFMSFDLVNYFFMLPLTDKSKNYTCFYGGRGLLYRYNTCPQGLKPSPNWAQKNTAHVTRHTIRVTGYIDDYLSYGRGLDGLYESAESFLYAASHFGLRIGPKKTILATSKIDFLGFSISANTVHRIQPGKITSLRELKSPKNKDDLRSLLGTFSWYASRSNLRDKLAKIRAMAKSHVRFVWNDELEADLRDAIEALLDPLTGVLRVPVASSPRTPFVLLTDASSHSLGAVLGQIQRVGIEEGIRDKLDPDCHRLYLISFYNVSVPKEEALLPIALKELKGLYLALKHYEIYTRISTHPCIVYSDSRVVCCWMSMDVVSPKVARWLNYISEFNIVIRFIPSKMNHSDSLSRLNNDGQNGPEACNPFSKFSVFNGQGKLLKNENIFSLEKSIEMNNYFTGNKRGPILSLTSDWRVENESPRGAVDLACGGFGSQVGKGGGRCISPPLVPSQVSPSQTEDEQISLGIHPGGVGDDGSAEIIDLNESSDSKVSVSVDPVCHVRVDMANHVGHVGQVRVDDPACHVRVDMTSHVSHVGNVRVDNTNNFIENQDASLNSVLVSPNDKIGDNFAPVLQGPSILGVRSSVRPSNRVAGRRNRVSVKDSALPMLKKKPCGSCFCLGLGEIIDEHCFCSCNRVCNLQQEPNSSPVADINNVFLTSTEEQLLGREQLQVVDAFADVVLPELSAIQLEEATNLQKGAMTEKVVKWLNKEIEVPQGCEYLSYNSKYVSILRHLSLFRINTQNIIFRIFTTIDGGSKFLIFVDPECLDNLILKVHEAAGHASKKLTKKLMSIRYYSPGLFFEIHENLKKCTACIAYNVKRTVKEPEASLIATQSKQVLQVDVMGPLPMSSHYKYIFAGIDSYDRTVYARPLKSTEGREICQALIDIFSNNGLWEALKFDYQCITFKGVDAALLSELKIGLIRSNTCSKLQGQIERFFQSLLIKILKLLHNDETWTNWPKALPKAVYLHNCLPTESLAGRSPFEVLYRRPPRLVTPLILPVNNLSSVSNISGFKQMVVMSDEIRNAAYVNMVRNKNHYRPDEGLKENDVVFRKRTTFGRANNRKWQIKISDAFRVVVRVGTGLYKLINIRTNEPVILSGDQLIRTNLTEAEALLVIEKLKA